MLLGTCLGCVFFDVLWWRRRLMLAQLRAALPELSPRQCRRLGRRVWKEQCLNVLELLAAPRLLRVKPLLHHGALPAGGGLLLSAHLGNFELASYAAALRGERLFVVSKQMSVGVLDRLWRRYRASFGIEVLCGSDVIRQALRALEDGAWVAFTLDQHSPERRAVEAAFLGLPARSSAALATLAVRSHCAIVPVFCCRSEAGLTEVSFGRAFQASPGADVRQRIEATTRQCLALVEQAVREHPECWLWLHRRWKDAQGRPLITPGPVLGSQTRKA